MGLQFADVLVGSVKEDMDLRSSRIEGYLFDLGLPSKSGIS